MAAVETYFSLGSNLGDRSALLERALQMMQDRLPGVMEAVSSPYESAPQGFDSPNRFLNLAARFRLELPETEEAALQVLDICQDIERELGKNVQAPRFDARGQRIYADRPIDIDLIFLGSLRLDHPRLTLPHPRWQERDFVRIPLREVASPELLRIIDNHVAS